jgi:hypothetical protein
MGPIPDDHLPLWEKLVANMAINSSTGSLRSIAMVVKQRFPHLYDGMLAKAATMASQGHERYLQECLAGGDLTKS